jgi:hypothetical protein
MSPSTVGSKLAMDSLTTALDVLARHRARNTRKSQETFDAGVIVLEHDAVSKLGDDSELGIAAVADV